MNFVKQKVLNHWAIINLLKSNKNFYKIIWNWYNQYTFYIYNILNVNASINVDDQWLKMCKDWR